MSSKSRKRKKMVWWIFRCHICNDPKRYWLYIKLTSKIVSWKYICPLPLLTSLGLPLSVFTCLILQATRGTSAPVSVTRARRRACVCSPGTVWRPTGRIWARVWTSEWAQVKWWNDQWDKCTQVNWVTDWGIKQQSYWKISISPSRTLSRLVVHEYQT